MRRGEWGDPAQVLERRQAAGCHGCVHEIRIFDMPACGKDKRHGKRCKQYEEISAMSKCPEHVRQAMYDWGRYARRPQLWENLKARNIYGVLPVPSKSVEIREIFLDPASARIHRSVMRLQCEKTKGVLYAYYVCGVSYDHRPELFDRYGIGRRWFYELVVQGSIMAVNASKSKEENFEHA